MNLKITAMILEREGYHTQKAASAFEALDYLEEHQCDLILMDLDMPGMDGIQCTQRIRALGTSWAETVPIVALTATTDDATRNKAFVSGMNDYLTKPFTPLDLLHGVARNLELVAR
ncbi:response regulator, partial [Arthrospira platensis SPKY1]|nr:response regulator [Arthrospira platensis SPKY1]